MVSYTLVCGVDKKHLNQLKLTWPTWKKHKPGLLKNKMLIFRDHTQVSEEEVKQVVDHPNLKVVQWPPIANLSYGDDSGEKWTNPQRVKMLTGFIYIPAMYVGTEYWLKVDTDVVATGQPDWISPDWFDNSPAMVCPPWGFTRPPNQMLEFDGWIHRNSSNPVFEQIFKKPHLDLCPKQGADRLHHKRICSWCGFFKSSLSRLCFTLCQNYKEPYSLPKPTQDGLMWYVAKRMEMGIVRVKMKSMGWTVWGSHCNLVRHSAEVMSND